MTETDRIRSMSIIVVLMILATVLVAFVGGCTCLENCPGGYGPRCPAGTIEMLNPAGTAFVCIRRKK